MKLNIIYNKDCLEGLKDIKDNSINTIVTSPPYNKKGLAKGRRSTSNSIWKKHNIDYSDFNDNMKEEDYQEWQIKILNECYRVLKEDGSMFYNHKMRRYNNSIHSPELWLHKTNFKLYQLIIWNRKNSPNMRNDHLIPNTELIYWLSKKKPKVFKKNIDKEYRGEIWTISPKKQKNHPAPFPELIPELCIKLTTEENDIILDPFMGSGTTAKAAEKLNRNYLGFEITEEYINS